MSGHNAFLSAVLLAIFAITQLVSADDRERPESSRATAADGSELPRGRVNYMGRPTNTDRFLKTCRQTIGRTLEAGGIKGRAVRITGQLSRVGESGWTVLSKENRNGEWEQPVAIEFSEIGGVADQSRSGFKPGHIVCVHGIAGDGASVRAWFVDLLPPGVKWECNLRNPGAVVSGQNQTFHVDCVVKNTGRQTLRNVQFGVRLAQADSPNDEIETHTIDILRPGESATFTVDFTFFNFQYIGKTSLPVGQASVMGYDL